MASEVDNKLENSSFLLRCQQSFFLSLLALASVQLGALQRFSLRLCKDLALCVCLVAQF